MQFSEAFLIEIGSRTRGSSAGVCTSIGSRSSNAVFALSLTQEQMALLLGTSVSGYRKWEQRVRQPSGAARTLLRVMEREPDAVLRALG